MANNMNCYMSMMQKQRGDEWLVSLRPEDIQRSAKRIVKEIARGCVDYQKYGYCFLDSKFLENLIIGISNELEINTLNYNACTFYGNYYPNTANLGAHIAHLYAVCNIYTLLLARLNNIKITGDITPLVDIPALVYSDRNHINLL